MSHYSKFCQTVLDADIVEVGINEYHVCSRAGDKHVHRTWPCATARVARKDDRPTVDTWPPSRRNLTSGLQPGLYYQTKKERYSIRSLLVKKGKEIMFSTIDF